MKFFIADLHFDHAKIAQIRGFSSAEEMNEHIIKVWNDTILLKDEVHIIGDFFLGKTENLPKILNKLNGKLILTKGNHDNSSTVREFESRYDVPVKEIRETYVSKDNFKTKAVLCHFPIEYWNKMFHYIHIHGHMHNEEISHIKNRICVSWEVSGKPLNEIEIIERCQKKNFLNT